MGLTVAVIGLGYFGPHPAPPAPPLQPSFLAVNPTAIASSPSPTAAPSVPTHDATNPLDKLVQVTPSPGQIKQSWLPGQITSRSMAIVSGRLYYIVDGDRIQSTEVGSNRLSQTVLSVAPCQGINQIAAAGHELTYVVTSPGGSSSQVGGCGDGSSVAWSVWLLDLLGGTPREVGGGSRQVNSIDVAEFPVHVALTQTAYAFNRPPSSAAAGPGEAVEVHSLDGRLLWTSEIGRPVADVMLGGDTLAILTDVISHSDGILDLWRSDAAHPVPHRVDGPATSASLSPDGSYLTWDLPAVAVHPETTPLPVVGIETLDPGTIDFPATATSSDTPVARRPVVSSTAAGLLVAWFATAPGGAVYPAFRYVGGASGAVLPSLQQPVWLSIEGSTLTWVAASSDGWSKTAYAIDVSSLGLR